MAGIVLAVAERPLAVLPGLAPPDRGERNEKPVASGGKGGPLSAIEPRSALEPVLARRIVIHVAQPQEIRLGRMQVTARRVDAQRPARLAVLLPCRESHGAAQKLGDRGLVER